MRFLFVDRILERTSHVIRGVKQVTTEDFFLCEQSPGQWGFIPSLVGEAIGQLAAWHVMANGDFRQRPVAGLVDNACFHRPVYVGETLWLEACIEQVDESAVQYSGSAKVNATEVFTLSGAVGPMLPIEDFIHPDVARQQFAEIDRPCSGEQELRSHSSIKTQHAGQWTCPPISYDHITAYEPGVLMQAEKRVTRAAPYFPDHFPNKPVLPLTILLECKRRLAEEFVNNFIVRDMQRIKMKGFIQPGDVVRSTVHLKHQSSDGCLLHVSSEVDGRRVCVVDMRLIPKDS